MPNPISVTETPPAQPDAFANEQAMSSLLHALGLLNRRGIGGLAWSTPFHDDPIAFMLDSINDALNVWSSEGTLVYQNRAATGLGLGQCSESACEEFTRGGRRYERRCLRCGTRGRSFLLELIHELPSREAPDAS